MGASLSIYLQAKNSNLYIYALMATPLFIALISYSLIIATKKSDPYLKLESIKRKKNV
jgi:hypothetical protein